MKPILSRPFYPLCFAFLLLSLSAFAQEKAPEKKFKGPRTGQFPDGLPFDDIREFKAHLLKDEPSIARNLARHLSIYATGAPIGYSDRAGLETIVKNAAIKGYGVRTIIHEIVQSNLFRNK
jgi:hypothetical protein